MPLYDGALRPYRTPDLIDITLGEGERICANRSADNCWHHYGIKRYHRTGTDGNLQRWHRGVPTSTLQPEDIGKIQDILSLIPPQAKESGNNHRERGIRCGGTKYQRCTASPYIRESRGDWPHKHNFPRNADAYPRSIGTGTSQCSPYKIEHGGNCTIFTYDCDHEQHAGVTQDAIIVANEKNKDKEKNYCCSCRSIYPFIVAPR